MKTAEEFINEIEGSEGLKNELREIKDIDSLSDLLKKHHVGVAVEEFIKAVKAKSEVEGEMGDDVATAVTGGMIGLPPEYWKF